MGDTLSHQVCAKKKATAFPLCFKRACTLRTGKLFRLSKAQVLPGFETGAGTIIATSTGLIHGTCVAYDAFQHTFDNEP